MKKISNLLKNKNYLFERLLLMYDHVMVGHLKTHTSSHQAC